MAGDDEGMGTAPEGGLGGRAIAAILAILLACIGAGIAITWNDDDGPGPHRGGTITVGSANDKQVAATPDAVERAENANGEHTGLGNDYATPGQLRKDDAAASPQAPRITGPVPAASPHQRGCLTRSNTANFSYRSGIRPSIGVPHLTVAPNRPGWDDINGVWIFLNRPATSASANYIVDSEGHCIYSVAESLKAWTQANLNSATACSVEQQNTGNEPTYAGVYGLRKTARVFHDCFKRWHIPLRRGKVFAGVVVRSGLIDHYHLGIAGGGHIDIHNFGAGCRNQGPSANTWKCVDTILRLARALDRKPISARQRGRCKALNRLRVKSRPPGPQLTATEKAAAKRYKAGFRRYKLRCSPPKDGKPGRIVRL